MQYYSDCKNLQLLFCILFFLSTSHCFLCCKLIRFGKYCSHCTVSIVSIVTFVNKCCVLEKKKKKLFSKELITFSTDDIKSCETRTELYTQDGSEHDR